MTGSNLTKLKQIELEILPCSKADTGPQFWLNSNDVDHPDPRLLSDVAATQTRTHTTSVSVIYLEY